MAWNFCRKKGEMVTWKPFFPGNITKKITVWAIIMQPSTNLNGKYDRFLNSLNCYCPSSGLDCLKITRKSLKLAENSGVMWCHYSSSRLMCWSQGNKPQFFLDRQNWSSCLVEDDLRSALPLVYHAMSLITKKDAFPNIGCEIGDTSWNVFSIFSRYDPDIL